MCNISHTVNEQSCIIQWKMSPLWWKGWTWSTQYCFKSYFVCIPVATLRNGYRGETCSLLYQRKCSPRSLRPRQELNDLLQKKKKITCEKLNATYWDYVYAEVFQVTEWNSLEKSVLRPVPPLQLNSQFVSSVFITLFTQLFRF